MSLSRPSLRAASLLLAMAVGMSGTLLLAHATPARAETIPGDTVTVFVDATFGFRKNHMASKLTRTHAEYAARGYHFVDMEPYNENGDLVGFFVTYAR
ncbi:MAG TPA: hypothetical protein VFH59_14050 [Frateuria sp.]|uniref:hypothetical protein n=1 Tax=Frateuria sp. TaxID=2211372 RepID=UPI002D7FCB99|nr:hypothetical protein [Frateuria sp.]HET6806552.1 hypothetical protein [Frateuria sp.]